MIPDQFAIDWAAKQQGLPLPTHLLLLGMAHVADGSGNVYSTVLDLSEITGFTPEQVTKLIRSATAYGRIFVLADDQGDPYYKLIVETILDS